MSSSIREKPHAVLVPYPSQGHITPTLKLAKLLHSHGFHITFLNTEFNHQRLLHSHGSAALAGLPDFLFEAIPDGLPPSNPNATQDLRNLCASIQKNFLLFPFIGLLEKLNNASSGVPRVTQIVADGMMSFCFDAGKKLDIPVTAFWTASACGLMGYLQFHVLVQRGIVPLKDESYISNGYLDTPVDFIPGMNDIRLKDLPSFLRTIDPNDIFFNFLKTSARRIAEAKAIIINTFDNLERPVLSALSALLPPPIYTIGPIHLHNNPLPKSFGANLWKEEPGCVEWLNAHAPRSVVFVNFGSITVMTKTQLLEFACGLANSGYHFLWVVRGDLVEGETALLPQDFVDETKGRGKMVSWCAQEEVLLHSAVGVFLTHVGWNSILESFSAGVPVVCWPFFAEQMTNCRYVCVRWMVGMEIDKEVKREEVEGFVREMMDGECKGREMRKNAVMWRESAIGAIEKGGSSFVNFEKVVKEVLVSSVSQGNEAG